MKKDKKSLYEYNLEELQNIANSLKSGSIKLSEISSQVQKAKLLYEECKNQLESVKLEVLEFEEKA